MRLIDADALLEDFSARQNLDCSDGEFCDCFLNDAQEVSTEWWCVEDAVESAPTIDAALVVHARWEETNCTACGKSYMEYAEGCSYPAYCEGELYTPDFCPHCGAKMDGGANDG